MKPKPHYGWGLPFLPGPFWANSLISVLHILVFCFPLCPAFAEEPGTSTIGLSVTIWKVGGEKPGVFLGMQSANSGWWFITSWETVHNWVHKQSQHVLLSWVPISHCFHLRKLALFSIFLTFYSHFVWRWVRQGQSRGERWSWVWYLCISGSFINTNWMWIKYMFTFLSN